MRSRYLALSGFDPVPVGPENEIPHVAGFLSVVPPRWEQKTKSRKLRYFVFWSHRARTLATVEPQKDPQPMQCMAAKISLS